MSRCVALTWLAAVCLATTGCASIISGTTQNVSFRSRPVGAKIRISTFKGVAPTTLELPKGKDYEVEMIYRDQRTRFVVQRRFDYVALLNLLFPPGFLVDLATGAMWKYEPSVYMPEFPRAAP